MLGLRKAKRFERVKSLPPRSLRGTRLLSIGGEIWEN